MSHCEQSQEDKKIFTGIICYKTNKQTIVKQLRLKQYLEKKWSSYRCNQEAGSYFSILDEYGKFVQVR